MELEIPQYYPTFDGVDNIEFEMLDDDPEVTNNRARDTSYSSMFSVDETFYEENDAPSWY